MDGYGVGIQEKTTMTYEFRSNGRPEIEHFDTKVRSLTIDG
jgi:hypothetical protein